MIVSASAFPKTRVRPAREPGVTVPRRTITVPSPVSGLGSVPTPEASP